MTNVTSVLDPRSSPAPATADAPEPATVDAPAPFVHDLAAALRTDAVFDGRVTHVEELPARAAQYAADEVSAHPAVAEAFARQGISRLWTHQADAIAHARAGRHVAVATGTASGKSLAYLVPASEAAFDGGTSLLLYPTKALARDQLRRIRRLRLPGIEAAAVDGDTDSAERAWARRNAHLLVSNPDFVHRTLLPDHPRWTAVLKRLRFIVLDEVHTLRGVYGSHVAHIVRRLRRVAQAHGADPVIVCTSATVGDPNEVAAFCERITGVGHVCVGNDGSPAPARTVALWNPPLLDPETGVRASPVGETGRLLAYLVDAGVQTLAFASGRKAAELIARIARETLGDPHDPRVVAYRGGYLPEERRLLEDAIATGTVRGVAATNALELGMDIGGLDAVLLCGFPGTVASFRQQLGRAGRSADRPAFAALIAGNDQLDQWYLANPAELFGRAPETPVVNPDNERIATAQLACASYESPLRADEPTLSPDMDAAAGPLLAHGAVGFRGGRLHWRGGRSPARQVSIRSSSGDPVEIVDIESGRVVGTVDANRAPTYVHPGAVYLHQGETWVIDDLDLDYGTATAGRHDVDYYTQPRTETDVEVLAHTARLDLGRSGVQLHLGRVRTTKFTVGYRRMAFGSTDTDPAAPAGSGPAAGAARRARPAPIPLDLPPQQLDTTAFWYTIPDDLLDELGLDTGRSAGVVHACEHAGIGILPRFAICDRWDLGGVSTVAHPDVDGAVWFIYDGFDGGIGIAEAGFATGLAHVAATHASIAACGCETGCPSCVQSPKCGNWNEPLDKAGAVSLLGTILARAGD